MINQYPNKNVSLGLPNAIISPGVFSRTYRLQDNPVSVVYHTPTQCVTQIEGHTAEVWNLIIEDRGNLHRALAYILKNGQFETDPETEATSILAGFVKELEDLNFLQTAKSHDNFFRNTPSSNLPGGDIEKEISLLMSDNHILHNLTLEMTHRCNEKCVHCYCPPGRRKDELSLDQIIDLLNEFESLGGLLLQLTGGELFVRPETKNLLRHLQTRNFVVSLISNLTLLDDELIDIICGLHPKSVGCSIYSADPHVHDAVTRVAGSHKQSLGAIRSLRDRDIPVIMKTPLMRHTVNGWRDVDSLAKEMGCASQFDLNISAGNDGNLGPVKLRVGDRAIISELFDQRFRQLYQHGEAYEVNEENSDDVSLCGAGSNGLSIGPTGEINPCIGLPNSLGKWPKDTLAKVWENSPFFETWAGKHLRDISKCSACQHVATCLRCPGSWFTELGSLDTPNEYTCFLAEIAGKTFAAGRKEPFC